MTGGTVVLMVINGDRGNGFSVQTHDPRLLAALPDLLERVAADMRESMRASEGT